MLLIWHYQQHCEWMCKPWVQACPLLVGPCSPVAPLVLPCPARINSCSNGKTNQLKLDGLGIVKKCWGLFKFKKHTIPFIQDIIKLHFSPSGDPKGFIHFWLYIQHYSSTHGNCSPTIQVQHCCQFYFTYCISEIKWNHGNLQPHSSLLHTLVFQPKHDLNTLLSI